MLDKAVLEIVASIATVAAVVAQSVYNARGDRRRDQRHSDSQTELRLAQQEIRAEMAEGFTRVDASVNELRAYVVGPDGENGLRGDVREIKKRVIGLEDREREHLVREVGTYQPPRGT